MTALTPEAVGAASLIERLQALVDSDRDHMVASGEDLEWLVRQSLYWPQRIHPDRTTNDRFLRFSMAATLLHALHAQSRDAVIEECAAVADRLADQLRELPRHQEPSYSAEAMWNNVEDAARDISDAIRQLKQPAGGESAIDGGRGGVG